MNGEVMDDTIVTPQQSKNEVSRYVQLSEDKGIGGNGQQTLSGCEEERIAGERPDIIPEVGKEILQVAEKNGPNSSISEGETSPSGEICVGNVKDREVHLHDQKLEGLFQEGPPRAPTTSTNGLEQNDDKKHLNKKRSLEPESELDNNNSKDSSMLSTTDTQDEIDTIDNGDQIFINHIHNRSEEASKIENDKKKILKMEVESEDSIEEMLGSDLDPQTEETFSIVSGSDNDEASQESVPDKSNDDIVSNKDGPPTQNGNKTPEIHEIDSEIEDDDCVVTADDMKDKNITSENKKNTTKTSELRRSSRTIKRKKYSYDYENIDGVSDIEEFEEDVLKRKSRPIMINDTKSLVEIAAKQAARSTSAQRKEPQLVLIGSKTTAKPIMPNKMFGSNINASLYQSIVARGTTVTPVPSKQPAAMSTQIAPMTAPPCTPTPAILPSLTDDMFVVEAPSFIVPYVYEKPSIEPFKEFVTNLGKQLEDQRAKAEKEILEKRREEKRKLQKEKQEKKDRGEEVGDSEEEGKHESDEIKKRRMEKKEQRRRQKVEDDESWDGSDSSDSEDFKITNEDGTTIVINDSIEEAKNAKAVPASTSKSDNYFDCSLGKFFMTIGTGLVEEYVQSDLLKQQKRKLQREKKTGQSTKERELSISLLMKNLELSKENNEPYTCSQLKCEHCTFKTESALVLAQHLETPHMKNNMYKCNFCSFEIRSPHDILFHMEAEHNVCGKLERAPSYHQCANCPFEDNGKGKLARHLVACAKKFKPEQNLNPPIEWEPPAKIPKVAKARNALLGSPYAGTGSLFGRQQFGSSFGRPPIVTGVLPGGTTYRPRGRFPVPAPRPVQAGGSIVRGSSMLRQSAPNALTNYSMGKPKNPGHQPSISITPLPRQPPPVPVHVQAGHVQASQNSKGTFVICEICDGYIKDLDQLRNHMQWIHKVKIHPKMIYNRPPLNCQKCQFRFFTDQGLERHLLGSHGLVTSSMQEAANKSKDAGRCPVCGKVYQWKLLNHVARDHNLTLKPAHLSYKCTVCTATFGMYKLFENHVYSAHSVVAKRVMDKNVPIKTKSNAPKGLKINDQITITAQPAKPTAAPVKDK